MKLKKNLLLWNYWANLNQTLLKWSLGGPLPKLCPAFQTSDQDGHHSQTWFNIGPYGKFPYKSSCLKPLAQLEPSFDSLIFILWIYKWIWFSYGGYMNECDFHTVDIWMGVIFILWIYEWVRFSYCGYMNGCDCIVDIWMDVIFVLWIYEWVWFSYCGYINGYDFHTVDIWMGMIFILWIYEGVIFMLWIYEWVWFSYCGYINGYDFHAGGIYHGIWMFCKVQLHLVSNFTICDPPWAYIA